MSSEVKKSLLAASGVVIAVIAAYGGAVSRDHVDGVSGARGDLLTASKNSHEVQAMVASLDNTEIPEGDYFSNLTLLVKREFVEPVTDDQKLASGAVRGMIASLGDPQSLYMDAKEFRVFLGQRQGRYEGVGADLELIMPGKPGSDSQAALQPTDGDPEAAAAAPRIPKLTVVAVTPGGPADKAGVKAGDTVASVDGHWVVSGDLLVKFRLAEKKFLEKKIDAIQLNAVRKEIHAKSERALLPLRAWDRLSEGVSGSIAVVWDRAGTQKSTSLQKSLSSMAPFTADGSRILLPLTGGQGEHLEKAISGKSEITLDLRNNVLGDFDVMKQCLSVLAPKGEYGRVFSVHNPRGLPIVVKAGNTHPLAINLVVDRTTRGAAEILALALSSHHLAKLTGSEMGGDRSVEQVVELPDGSGYTLKTGTYRPITLATAGLEKKKGGA
jgi:carboxyl-terminal processing protease